LIAIDFDQSQSSAATVPVAGVENFTQIARLTPGSPSNPDLLRPDWQEPANVFTGCLNGLREQLIEANLGSICSGFGVAQRIGSQILHIFSTS
jgi:hypothetical protein